MFVAGIGDGDWVQPGGNSPIIRSRVEMKAWLLDYLGDEPSIGLAFLGTLYAKIRLTEESLMLDEPTGLRERILSQIDDPGVAMGLLKSAIDQAKELIQRREHPNVLQGDDPGAPVVKQPSAGPGLSTVPGRGGSGRRRRSAIRHGDGRARGIALQLACGRRRVSSHRHQRRRLDGIGTLAREPRDHAVRRRAKKRGSGSDPHCWGTAYKTVFRVGYGFVFTGRRPSNPTLQIRRDEGAEVMGVIRQLISRFGDLRRARTEPSKETRS